MKGNSIVYLMLSLPILVSLITVFLGVYQNRNINAEPVIIRIYYDDVNHDSQFRSSMQSVESSSQKVLK